MSGLTEKQLLFACEYLKDQNATQSAIRAGYSEKTAYSIGQRLLKKVEVRAYIDEKLKEMENQKIAKAEEVLQYLTSVMRGEQEEETIVVEGQGDGISKAVKVKKEVSPKERIKAAEWLGKAYGLFTEKVEASVNNTPTIIGGEEELEE